MTGHIELRNDANSAFGRISNNLARLILCVEEPVRTHLLQLGKLLTLDPKSLVLSQVPVKHVELHRRHGVKVSLEHFHGLIVTRDIDQKTAPWKARLILNLYRRKIE